MFNKLFRVSNGNGDLFPLGFEFRKFDHVGRREELFQVVLNLQCERISASSDGLQKLFRGLFRCANVRHLFNVPSHNIGEFGKKEFDIVFEFVGIEQRL